MDRVWGFDIGTTSVGFAVVEMDEEKSEGRIVHEGVRIFPEGREEEKLEPRNQARRAASMQPKPRPKPQPHGSPTRDSERALDVCSHLFATVSRGKLAATAFAVGSCRCSTERPLPPQHPFGHRRVSFGMQVPPALIQSARTFQGS